MYYVPIQPVAGDKKAGKRPTPSFLREFLSRVGGPIPIDRGVHMGLFRAVWAYMDLDYQKKRLNVKVEVFEGFERGLKVVQAHLCHLLC